MTWSMVHAPRSELCNQVLPKVCQVFSFDYPFSLPFAKLQMNVNLFDILLHCSTSHIPAFVSMSGFPRLSFLSSAYLSSCNWGALTVLFK